MHKNKALVSLVFGLGIILIGGFSLLAYGLYQRATDPDFKFFKDAPAGSVAPVKTAERPPELTQEISRKSAVKLPPHITLPLPEGARISALAATGNKIIVHITTSAKQDRVLILDADSGGIIRRIHFDTPP